MSTSVGDDAKYRRFIDFLHANNVGKYVELPQIAVMGDTSSGKSSLLSAISTIPFPANDALTTRCPIRLRMERRGELLARVDIKWHSSLDQPARAKWAVMEHDDSNWENISDSISTAQDFILGDAKSGVSRDIVEVSVFGPTFNDLTLIDLPGIVRSVGQGESQSIIEDINLLIRDFLNNNRCIILAIVPANVDFHNSQIMADAVKVDPDTKRTIPVITKPDTIDLGAEGSVLDLLLGKKLNFAMGFHMVKCRGQKALNDGVSIQDGIIEEERFFASRSPWREEEDRSIFGIRNIREKLAGIQIGMIERSLPSIIEEIATKRIKAETDVKKLGHGMSTIREKSIFFGQCIDHLERQLRREINGESGATVDEKGFTMRANVQKLQRDFNNHILELRLAKLGDITVESKVLLSMSDGTEIEGVVKDILGNGCFYVEDDTNVGQWDPSLVRLRPDWLLDLLKRNSTRDLPCFISPTLFNAIVAKMIRNEFLPRCLDLLDRCYTLLLTALDSAISANDCGRYPSLCIRERAVKLADDVRQIAQGKVEDAMRVEEYPHTLNHYLFDVISKKRTEVMRNKIMHVTKTMTDADAMRKAISAIFDATEKLSMDEYMARDMEIILSAYGKVASKRIIDTISAHMDNFLFDGFLNALKDPDSFYTSGEDLDRLIRESDSVVVRRTAAVEMVRVMEAAEKAMREMRVAL